MNSTSMVQANPPEHQMQYSFMHQIAMGNVPQKADNQSSTAYIDALPSPVCGQMQHIYSP